MLIDFNVNCNNYSKKILNNYSILDYVCPKCGAKHSLTRHGSYERNLCLIDDYKKTVDIKMTILRVKCSSCNSTHAILPSDIIPYCIYSFSSILKILTKFYSNEHTVLELCSTFSISFQVLYMLVSRFSLFLNSCITVLRNLGYAIHPTPDTIVSKITTYQLTESFLYQYFLNCQWVFLMSKFQNILPRPVYIGGFY